ncbi:DUF6728 family protein [Pseudochryseolinea flava]|uniref:Uncharacterized protein n=1 Tax=Pseudochryseolinea flava TaxID=2059302 RepID=A0A364XWF6_9BACT|nr:DUF6728 family protein [Pseudochryseolinea flava]RAV98668.1 hypothetical protein DQQ10_22935 [Pseudochryseolinea flava]
MENTKPRKSSWKDFFRLGEVGTYFFRKRDASRPANVNLRMMHGVNKFSIVVFIIAVFYLVLKRIL